MLIEQKIKRNSINQNVTIKIPIVGENILSGDEQEISKYVDKQTNLFINPVIDGEKFKYFQKTNIGYSFQFYDTSTQTYSNSLLTLGFSNDELIEGSESLRNSFFIAQYYDAVDLDNQTLLHSSYLNGYEIFRVGENALYNNQFIKNTQLSEVYLPEQFVDTKANDIFTIYVRYFFFNSKNGVIYPMLAGANENSTTSQRLFYDVTINKNVRSFSVVASSPVSIKQINSVTYRNKITNTVDELPREKQNPPAGQRFTPLGEYEESP